MEIPALNPAVKADQLPLERLSGNPRLSESEKVAELSRQFEAVLLRQILHHAQKTVIKSDLAPESASDGIYQDMITNQLADSISKSGAFGLGRSLERELTRQLLPAETREGGQIED